MTSATIKLFLPHADARRLRVGEVSNWTGKALAAPRTELDDLLAREETESSGVYFLLGVNPETGDNLAYIGEAEVIRDRLKQHKAKDFWTSVVVFVSKDENLTKAHIRYLENRLLHEAKAVGRYKLENTNTTNPKLPESDREDMEVYLSRIRQVLPVLGVRSTLPHRGIGQANAAPASPSLQDQERRRNRSPNRRGLCRVCEVNCRSLGPTISREPVPQHDRPSSATHSGEDLGRAGRRLRLHQGR